MLNKLKELKKSAGAISQQDTENISKAMELLDILMMKLAELPLQPAQQILTGLHVRHRKTMEPGLLVLHVGNHRTWLSRFDEKHVPPIPVNLRDYIICSVDVSNFTYALKSIISVAKLVKPEARPNELDTFLENIKAI